MQSPTWPFCSVDVGQRDQLVERADLGSLKARSNSCTSSTQTSPWPIRSKRTRNCGEPFQRQVVDLEDVGPPGGGDGGMPAGPGLPAGRRRRSDSSRGRRACPRRPVAGRLLARRRPRAARPTSRAGRCAGGSKAGSPGRRPARRWRSGPTGCRRAACDLVEFGWSTPRRAGRRPSRARDRPAVGGCSKPGFSRTFKGGGCAGRRPGRRAGGCARQGRSARPRQRDLRLAQLARRAPRRSTATRS